MDSITFTVPGRIAGKGRPRAAMRGGHVRMYTPAKTANAEALVRSLAYLAMGDREPFQGPLILDVTVTLNTPPSWSKKRKAAAFYVTGKPDIDNSIKLLADSMNGIVYGDDAQLCDLHFRRRYNDHAGESVEIQIYSPGQGEPSEAAQHELRKAAA